MQFNIRLETSRVDVADIEQRLQAIDPAGLADVDALNGMLRISANLSDDEIASLLHESGLAIPADRIERAPSVCCGGCGG